MPRDETTTAGAQAGRHMHRALAALREAAESLEEVAAAEEARSVAVAKATTHVAAARAVLKPQLFGPRASDGGRDAA